MDLSQLTPRRPYLLRAFYEWLLDNQLTPHLVVDVTLPGVQVPMEYARDGQIVLNIAPRAVGNLELANDEVRFNARFGGIPRQVSVPLAAVLAIYARENGAGTMFEPEAAYDEDASIMNDEEASADNETVMSVIDGDKPGIPRQVSVPLAAVLAIYARENGAGTMFEPEAAYDEDTSIMNDEEASADNETVMSVIDGDKPDHDDDTHPDDEPPQPPRGGRPALRVVK